jgi:Kef-type K+ transport system membrane component KefB
MDILLILGVLLFSGFGGGTIFRKLKIPQVVAYIVIGTVVGVSGLRVLDHTTIDSLSPLNSFALGLIGFMIGSELKLSIFRKLGRYIVAILLSEALAAYALVAVATYIISRQIHLALLLGALASATAPAATVDVLWEYKSKGILTSTLLAIVGLDDALALVLYGFSSAIAKVSLLHTDLSVGTILGNPGMEIGQALLMGAAFAMLLGLLIRFFRADNQILILSLATVLVCAGAAKTYHFSPILTCMFLGVTLTNTFAITSSRAYRILERFVPPIYVLFFILVGARLDIRLLPAMGLLGFAYIGARTAGKILGTRLGARISRAPEVLRKYLGLALFSQAGVAIGLAISVYEEFAHLGDAGRQVGILVVSLITATTFVVQLIGPPFVKYAITKAGEIGRNV